MNASDTALAPAEEGTPLPADRDWPRPWMAPFLRALSLIPDVSSACRVARAGRTTVYEHRDSNPAFAAAWEEALHLARDFIQRQAHTWATTGVPVRSVRTTTKRNAKGETVEETVITTESAERSATMMIFWLKAWYPDRYRWAERLEHTGADGEPILVKQEEIEREINRLVDEVAARRAAKAVREVTSGSVAAPGPT